MLRASTSDRSRPARPRCASTATPRISSTVIPAQAGTTAHPPLPSNPATLILEQECRTMPLSPQRRRPALTPVNLNLAIAHQNLTEVDTRLTKVDKGCQNLTPSTPAPTQNPSKTRQNRNRAHHPVNPPCQPLRRTPNNPEQIRTNLNKPEHRQAPRPDRPPPNCPRTPEKTNPEHRRRPPSVIPAQE